ncbi:hypothetical protein HUT16_27110 [Kitasatospora sp. NA04385]|uniref:hypothetical protein n=1 Tax=Kitasatospora sp. NA04385 TaxID=2742135 RepID=UPI0015926B48|nr:hypothetical protein [Kitasatospora sp. NA04385]QKW22250.1 hypothetical protein HUT16_27110 [Kitasatospora sp. NA04385]
MKTLDYGQLAEAMRHPRHHEMQQDLVPLIEQVRACHSERDGYEVQAELLGRLLAVEEDRLAFSQAVKRMKKGLAPQPGAPEPASGRDPGEIDTWIFERDLCERLGRQLRSLGDSLAWRAFNYDRRVLLSWCRNMPSGMVAGKKGLAAELAFVEEQWREHGRFALMHDLTNCLRIGDVTVWDPEAGPRIVEIKTSERHRQSKQQRRIDAAHAALDAGGNLPGDHPDERIHDLGIPLRTHLDLLGFAAERAASEAVCALKVPGSRALCVVDVYGMHAQGWTDDEFGAQLEKQWRAAKRRAGIDASPELNIQFNSLDSAARDPLRVPWASYPLHPVLCARLIGDMAVFTVETSGPRLADDLTGRGLPATWVRFPAPDGPVQPGEVVMEIDTSRSLATGPGGSLILQKKLQAQRSELDRYMIELMDQDSWVAGIRHLAHAPDISSRPWPVFRDEHLVWC